MTTTLPAPVSAPALPGGCPVERRALRSGARDLAVALTGIAFDAPCCPRRQREVVASSAGVLATVRAVAGRDEDLPLLAACATVAAGAPLFAAEVSAGAPGLVRAWTTVADLLEGDPAGAHDHAPEDLLRCARRFTDAAGSALLGVPWFLDACAPHERVRLVRRAPRRVRLALRLGEDRWLARRDAVRATPPIGAR
ncbi:hypothetical protein ACI782_17555 [Geodermatophilus sp. SYSU D00703]